MAIWVEHTLPQALPRTSSEAIRRWSCPNSKHAALASAFGIFLQYPVHEMMSSSNPETTSCFPNPETKGLRQKLRLHTFLTASAFQLRDAGIPRCIKTSPESTLAPRTARPEPAKRPERTKDHVQGCLLSVLMPTSNFEPVDIRPCRYTTDQKTRARSLEAITGHPAAAQVISLRVNFEIFNASDQQHPHFTKTRLLSAKSADAV